jgi:hypothetical protein
LALFSLGLLGVDPLRKPIILLPGAVPLLALLFFFLLVFAVAVGWMGPGGWRVNGLFFILNRGSVVIRTEGVKTVGNEQRFGSSSRIVWTRKSSKVLETPPKQKPSFSFASSAAIKTNNRQLYAVPELKLKQDGNSGSALRSNFCAWRKKQKQK